MAFSFFRSSKPRLVQTGPSGASRSHVLDQAETTIGRAGNADIVVDDPYLAPIHARIERQKDGGFIIRRMGLNPIILRGEALLQTASLKPDDRFRLGKDVEFQFVLKAAPADSAAKDAGKDGSKKPARPLLKRPEFLAAIGLVYLGAIGAVAWMLLSGGEEDTGGSSQRVDAEAAGIAECVSSARCMHTISEASFNGSVSGRAGGGQVTYAMLASSNEPADDAALAKAVAPIAEEYKRLALAAVASEIRGNLPLARSLYQQAFDVVPDINCSAAQFVMERRAATQPVAEE